MNYSYCDIILPLFLKNTYTFEIPEALAGQVLPGMRVEVQFGPRRHYAAIVMAVHNNAPSVYKTKPILDLLDTQPIVDERQLKLWRWIAEYYCCTLGEVMIAAVPAGLKLSSETKVQLNPDMGFDDKNLSQAEYLVVETLLNRHELSAEEVRKLLNHKSVMPLLKRMLDKQYILLGESLQRRYKEKSIPFVRFAEPYRSEPSSIQQAFDLIKGNATRQVEALMALIQLNRDNSNISVKQLCEKANITSDIVKKLADKGIVEIYDQQVSRLARYGNDSEAAPELTPQQADALALIRQSFEQLPVSLLHGVTGSGKTQLYIELIRDTIAKGEQVLYLLPEIALTAQIVQRLKRHFGEDIVLYHSRFNENERVEVWQSVMQGKGLVLGARSAVYMPFKKLGLIIVDEEHDSSFKQQEPAPRYNGRDTAIYLASLHGAKVLLGTATPSIETWQNAQSGKYGLVTLPERFGDAGMPEIHIADVKDAMKRKQMKANFTPMLLEAIQQALDQKQQVILFQNRRGYAPMYCCTTCGWIASCKSCDVSLTYHKFKNHLSCHYCGHEEKVPTSCPACGMHELKVIGFGTEKIEDDIQIYFPQAKVGRMDLDTVRGKHAYDRIIQDFEEHRIDILVGTQMVTKGLDFGKVALVGVLSADQLLFYPDFRASERAFQMLTQVAGRAGRRDTTGKVIIQAMRLDHPVLEEVRQQQFMAFINREMHERQDFIYPPYCRLMRIRFLHRDKSLVDKAASAVADYLRNKLADRVLGPTEPGIGRIKDQYMVDILLKLERDKQILAQARQYINKAVNTLNSTEGYKSVRCDIDVDPY